VLHSRFEHSTLNTQLSIFIVKSLPHRGKRLVGGGEGNRTPVQTYSTKAFYMLILLLFVGNEQESDQPIHCVAVCS